MLKRTLGSSLSSRWFSVSENPPWRDEALLRELYVEKGISGPQIAERLGCSERTVYVYLEDYGIDRRDKHAARGVPEDSPLRDEEQLRELYVEEEMSTVEIGKRLGHSSGCVQDWLNRFGIERRGPAGTECIPEDSPLHDEGRLRGLYVEQRMTLHKIAEKLGHAEQTVWERLKKSGIEMRDQSASLGIPKDSPLRDEEQLRELYVENNMTGPEIAEDLNCSSSTVYAWLKRHGIERDHPSGKNNGNWDPDKISEYGPSWTEDRRQAVRERDDHTCQDPDCDMTQAECLNEYDCRLHVHHLKKACEVDDHEERNAMENLVTLCPSCHRQWEQIAETGLTPQVQGVNAD